ncbi:adenylosuccinate synthetase [Caloranaerobacter azorensis H53214]|uniref:Adenylosuccinate synthetase n=1 Tax=Caloranaerobacter azorensis H53214 TaxID=1156417 RepID=A0A096DJQ1_9FIRM|nr:adenylosuccinate synthase [Caloranaerobacter azorensis]KGG79501.1 adenylosuccinate synthetase [Caloranaerobacter azorensis H53214]
MNTLVILGAQWGDEGKGKITDFLSEKADIVVRYQGGDNAGHTVEIGEKQFKLHLIPSGIFYEEKVCVIGNGVVVNPKSLLEEIKYLNDRGIKTDNLRISDRAHIIFPYHIKLDELEEKKRGKSKIGTTIKGIGPCYRDKVERSGIRMCDIFYKDILEEKIRRNIREKNEIIEKLYEERGLDEDSIVAEYMDYLEQIKKYVVDTTALLNEAIEDGKKILFEGAQGTLLDIDFGTYPYVTSSHPISGGVTVGTGISPFGISEVLGVVKAYTTRVGKGPFPTELFDETGDMIREKGHEYGTTTGRARRCGWLDTVMLRYSARINGLTSIVITKLDTLGGFEKIKICTAYELDGKVIKDFPSSLETLKRCKPIYEVLDGWKEEEIENVKTFDDLPENAKKYIYKIEELTGVKVKMVSIGPNRNATILRENIF